MKKQNVYKSITVYEINNLPLFYDDEKVSSVFQKCLSLKIYLMIGR